MSISKYFKLSAFAVFACALCACQDSSNAVTAYPSIQASTPQLNNTYVFAKGSQVDVPVTFTNTGNTANQTPNLNVNLANLPQGWSVKNSNSPNFNCSTVQANGVNCQLNLVYTAQALLNTTVLNLNYSYGSESSPQTGSISILYKVINPTFMYVSNPLINSLTKCILNPMDGKFLNCEIATEGLDSVSALSTDTSNNSLIAINYNSDSAQNTSMWQCPLDSEGNISSACSLNSYNLFPAGTFNSSSIILQTFLNNTYAYISNFPSTIVRCSVSTAGAFSGCTNITSVQGLSYPSDIAFLTLGSSNPTTYSYITQPAGSPLNGINLCTVSSDGSAFSNCNLTDSTDFPNTISAWGITFENFNNTNYAYVTTNDDQQYAIKQCKINEDTGGLYGCVITGEGFSGSAYKGSNQAVSFQKVNNKVYAYIPSAKQNNYISPGFVTKCDVDIDTGNLNNCVRITDESTLFSPGTIAFIDTNS